MPVSLLEFFHVGPGILREKKKPTNSAGTVASISSVEGPQFDFQGSIRHCPAAMTYGIRFSASTSFFPTVASRDNSGLVIAQLNIQILGVTVCPGG